MNKKDVENILISMKTQDNEKIIDKLLVKIRIIDEESFQNEIIKAGETEDAIIDFLRTKIFEMQTDVCDHVSINEMFTYGVSENCIHLHLPVDLHSMISAQGISKTIDIVNLYLLDAIDKLKELKNNGYAKFKNINSIYMISPILFGRELKFLEELGFQTRTYKKKDLNNEVFLKNNPEAVFAIKIFGKGKNIGIAQITFDSILSKEWQEKKINNIK